MIDWGFSHLFKVVILGKVRFIVRGKLPRSTVNKRKDFRYLHGGKIAQRLALLLEETSVKTM